MDKTMIFLNFICDRIQYPDNVTSLNGEPVKNVKTFKYFEDKLKCDESSTREPELKFHIMLAEATFYELLKNPTNHQINLTTRVLIQSALL